MRLYLAPILLLIALIAALVSLAGDDSFNRMYALEAELEARRSNNAQVQSYVNDLSAFVSGLKQDDRVLERAARLELGLAKRNEIIVVFPE